ncbi:MAG: hypothetical protein RL410_751, partial [Actinomycetota bacterium]
MTRDTLPRIRTGILILFFAMGFASSATATRLAEIKLRIGSGDAIFG